MKYDKLEKEYYKNNVDVTSLESILAKDEQVIWRGKPKKSAYLYSSFVKELPGLLSGLLTTTLFFVMVGIYLGMEAFWISLAFIGVFWVIGLFTKIGRLVTYSYRYKNIDYALTNRRIIIRSGLIGVDYKSINYKEVKTVKLDVTWIDRLFNVGDIYIYTGDEPRLSKSKKIINDKVFFDIPNCYEVYSKMQKVVVDIQTDMAHPNQFRKDNNTGYNTKKEKE